MDRFAAARRGAFAVREIDIDAAQPLGGIRVGARAGLAADDRKTAGHGFLDDERIAFADARQQEEIRRAVEFGDLGLTSRAEYAYVGEAPALGADRPRTDQGEIQVETRPASVRRTERPFFSTKRPTKSASAPVVGKSNNEARTRALSANAGG